MTRDEASGLVRPGLAGGSPLAEIGEILAQRTPLYERACDVVVNTDEKSPRAVSREIIKTIPATAALSQERDQARKTLFAASLNP